MKRDIGSLTDKQFDVVVVGGGAFGACAAWEASSRGLSVALVERSDFCQAASANHFKIVHGGIRYLQHMDIKRVRESSRERNILLRIAPHLVKPLPIIVPTYGYGSKSKPVLKAGLSLYDLLTFDRNARITDPDRRVPASSTISRNQVLQHFPQLDPDGLTGAGIFADGQMLNPPRLVLAFVQSAVEAGAVAANYVEAQKFHIKDKRVIGIQALDRESGDSLDISGRVVLNAAGPWSERLLDQQPALGMGTRQTFSRDACFIVRKKLHDIYGLAVSGRTSDPDAVLSREKRHLFIAPWRDYSLVGVWHVVYNGDPDQFTVTRNDLGEFLDEVNEAYPHLNLNLKDVVRWNAGLTLFGDSQDGSKNLSYGKRSVLCDHADSFQIEGLVTLIGVRATTARGMAEKAVDMILRKLNRRGAPSKTARIPVYGGDIDRVASHVNAIQERYASFFGTRAAEALSQNYGSAVPQVLALGEADPNLLTPIGSTETIKAAVLYALKEEMALHLSDVVYRRTELASGAYPGDDAITVCADLMAAELGWDPGRRASEIEAVKNQFQGADS